MRRWTIALLATLAFAAAGLAAPFAPMPPPASPNGTRATADLPASQHSHNTGGSDGAGLCVFWAIVHSARWQNVSDLEGFARWMEERPGGGYPSKVDAMLRAYCAERGVDIPPYVQHTGGDVEFLELALRTGRMPCVTYDGRDDFYRGRIAHMVSLVHLDSERAAILDNNRPTVFVWMSRADFLARWRGTSGGWAVVLLDAPPPPYAALPAPGPPLPTPRPNPLRQPKPRPCPGPCPADSPWQYVRWADGSEAYKLVLDGRFVGVWDAAGWHPATPGGWLAQPQGEPPIPPPAADYGVDLDRLAADRRGYSISGAAASREAVFTAVGATLTDDSHRWNLAAVGDRATLDRIRADVAALPAAARDRIHFTAFTPAAWQVSQFSLPAGVVLRKPAAGRVGAEVGGLAPGDYSALSLIDLLRELDGKRPTPAPDPDPIPTPVTPDPRSPDMIDLTPLLTWLQTISPTWAAIGAVGLWLVQRIGGRLRPGPAPSPASPDRPVLDLIRDVVRLIRRERGDDDEKREVERLLSQLKGDPPQK